MSKDRKHRPSYEAKEARIREERRTKSADILGAGPDGGFLAPHVYRMPRKIIDEPAALEAAAAFASGEIDRAELMRRITPGASK